ncbi:hypothetical protein [Natronobacterium texcoconense]|uniref:Uncharacterized protein n=1 Tax=Natronobacterium texcoconense TaxID=1095778 RepID=A0A1H1B4H5_NATTX|nr:hypothetical protein [Natronobacterium texcoconense]SDQ46807.1 hypothetical protein SAMN04489842_0919 [Natronobacterium texcoconense]
MIRAAVGRVRDRIDLGNIVVAVVVAVILSFFGLELSARDVVGTIVAVVVLAPIFGYVVERYEVDFGLLVISLGVIVGWGGIGHLQDGIGWLGWFMLALAVWLCLEGLDRFLRDDRTDDTGVDRDVTGQPETDDTDDLSRSELTELGERNRRLIETLRIADRPLSEDEIRTRASLSPEEFDRLLEMHGDSGPIDRVGTGYVLDERKMGVTGLVWTIGRRLLRPIRVLRPARRN